MKKGLPLIIALASIVTLWAANERAVETRTATKTVKISGGESINILGKNTNLNIEIWNKDEVEIIARITFYDEPKNRMQEFLDEFENIVADNIYENGGELTIDAELDLPNKVQIGGRNAGIVVGYGDDKLKLEYTIKLPGDNALKARSSYKSIIMAGEFSDVEINAYSCEFRAEDFNEAKLYLKYGEGRIKSIANGYMESYENDMEFGEVVGFEINDKYSEIKLDEVESLEIQGYETDIKAGSIGELKGNLKYGEMEVENRIGLASLTLYEYDIKAKSAGNMRMNNSKYSKVDLDKANEIRFVESYEDDLNIRFLNTLISKTKYGKYEIDQLGKTIELVGYEDDIRVGSIGNDAEQIDLDGKYLTLDINLEGKPFALNADTKYGKVEFDEDALDVRKYIKENDKLYIEAGAKGDNSAFLVKIKGYEIKAEID